MNKTIPGDLLRPSLRHGVVTHAPYSQQVGFLTAVLGGPVGALALGALNARRLGRLPRDLAWLAIALLAYLALEWWLATPDGKALLQLAAEWVGGGSRRIVLTVAGLLVFGVSSVAHRSAHRTVTLMGMAHPKGLWVGIGLILLGRMVSVMIDRALA